MRAFIAITTCAAVLTPSVLAGTFTPGLQELVVMTGTDGTMNWSETPNNVMVQGNGDYAWGASWGGAGNAGTPFQITTMNTDDRAELASFLGTNESDYNMLFEGNVDPVLAVNFSLINNTGSTQNYVLTFSLPVGVNGPFTLNGGSTGVTVTDINGDGATVDVSAGGIPGSLTPNSFYTAGIDGTDLPGGSIGLGGPLSAGAFLTSTTSGTFGPPIPSLAGPQADESIDIRYEFSLTAGDRIGVTGVYVVEPVPEPGAIVLMAAGSFLILRRRRTV
ncbi:MAG: PEP-CTERM sorting domain-containing protein [Phycisphaeraceae bacterium]|nr:PEP-CTERM sorting domain-containing protein [Phycisphaeraceae bacterium]